MTVYRVTKDKIDNPLTGSYITYGIEAIQNKRCVIKVSDVFVDLKKARRLAQICNCGALEPMQLKDVIEDALADSRTLLGYM